MYAGRSGEVGWPICMHFTHLTGQKVAPQVQLFAPLEYGDNEAAALHVTGTWKEIIYGGGSKRSNAQEFHIQVHYRFRC